MLGDSRHTDYITSEPTQVASSGALRIITHYPVIDIQEKSPTRPASLAIRLPGSSQHFTDLKNSDTTTRHYTIANGQSQQWNIKASENENFEKMLGHLGNNGSTPVTPTSFLNPKEITADQEHFADQFTKQLDRLQNEREGAPTSYSNGINSIMPTTTFSRIKVEHSEKTNSILQDSFSIPEHETMKLSPNVRSASVPSQYKLDSSVPEVNFSTTVHSGKPLSDDISDNSLMINTNESVHLTVLPTTTCTNIRISSENNGNTNPNRLYNLLPLKQHPMTAHSSPNTCMGSGSVSSGAILSNSSTSSASPTIDNAQRYNQSLNETNILIPNFQQTGLCLPPLRGSNHNQELLSSEQLHQTSIDYNIDLQRLRCSMPPTPLVSCTGSLLPATKTSQNGHQASDLRDVNHGDANLISLTTHEHVSTTTDGLLHILNAEDQSHKGTVTSQHDTRRSLHGHHLPTSNLINYNVLNDSIAEPSTSIFLNCTNRLDHQLPITQQQIRQQSNLRHINSDFIPVQASQQHHHLLMENGMDAQQLHELNFIENQNSSASCSKGNMSSVRKRLVSNMTNDNAGGPKKRNRRRHEPTIAAAQALVNASNSSSSGATYVGRGMTVTCQLTTQQRDMLNLGIGVDILEANGSVNAGSRHALKTEDATACSFEADVDDTSTHSSSVALGLNDCRDQSPGCDPNRIKVERKRARNRLAARRCRERKVSLIQSLEAQVSSQNDYLQRLENELERYRTEVNQLRHHIELLADSFPTLRDELLKLPPHNLFVQKSTPADQQQHIIIRSSFDKLEPQ